MFCFIFFFFFSSRRRHTRLQGDWSSDVCSSDLRELQEPLAVVNSIRRERLAAADRLNYDLFKRGVEEQIAASRFPNEYLVVTQLGGVQQDVGQLLAPMPTARASNYEDILARLHGVPTLVDQTLVLLEQGLAAGVTQI